MAKYTVYRAEIWYVAMEVDDAATPEEAFHAAYYPTEHGIDADMSNKWLEDTLTPNELPAIVEDEQGNRMEMSECDDPNCEWCYTRNVAYTCESSEKRFPAAALADATK